MEKKYLVVFRAYGKYSTNIYLYTGELTDKNEIDKIIENDFFDSFFDGIPDDAKFYGTFDL